MENVLETAYDDVCDLILRDVTVAKNKFELLTEVLKSAKFLGTKLYGQVAEEAYNDLLKEMEEIKSKLYHFQLFFADYEDDEE